ncbi:hypothetical protein C8Q79DRAFT_534929 [Trametes meyenii]|nr:hypothetical protein C8Q79DRAFT_534929 [Trametes meyenii]
MHTHGNAMISCLMPRVSSLGSGRRLPHPWTCAERAQGLLCIPPGDMFATSPCPLPPPGPPRCHPSHRIAIVPVVHPSATNVHVTPRRQPKRISTDVAVPSASPRPESVSDTSDTITAVKYPTIRVNPVCGTQSTTSVAAPYLLLSKTGGGPTDSNSQLPSLSLSLSRSLSIFSQGNMLGVYVQSRGAAAHNALRGRRGRHGRPIRKECDQRCRAPDARQPPVRRTRKKQRQRQAGALALLARAIGRALLAPPLLGKKRSTYGHGRGLDDGEGGGDEGGDGEDVAEGLHVLSRGEVLGRDAGAGAGAGVRVCLGDGAGRGGGQTGHPWRGRRDLKYTSPLEAWPWPPPWARQPRSCCPSSRPGISMSARGQLSVEFASLPLP